MKDIRETTRHIGEIARREIDILRRDRIYLLSMVIAPLLCAVFFLTLMGSGLPKDLPVAIVDQDGSSVSRNIIRQVDAFQQSDVVAVTPDFYQARKMMQRGEVYAILVIPKGLERDASSGRQPTLDYYTNNSFLIAGSLLYRDLRTMSVLASGAVQLQVGQARGKTDAQVMAQIQPIVVDTHPIGNPWLNYSVYLSNILLPGVLGLIIFITTVYSIGTEIKYGGARRLLEMSQGSVSVALAGKLLPHTIVFYAVGAAMLTVMYGLLGFPHQSGILPMLLLMLLFVLSAQALGIVMIGLLPDFRLGISFASLWGVISFSISGFSFPVSAMHPMLQALSNLFPLRHYFLVYVDQALNGLPLSYSAGHLACLAAFCLLPLPLLGRLRHALQHAKYRI